MAIKVIAIVLGLILESYAASSIQQTLVSQVDNIFKSHLKNGVQELLHQNVSCVNGNLNSSLILQQLEKSSDIQNMTRDISGVMIKDFVGLAQRNMTEFVITASDFLGTTPQNLVNESLSYLTNVFTGKTNSSANNQPSQVLQQTVIKVLSQTPTGQILLGNYSIVTKVQVVLKLMLSVIATSKPNGVNPTCYGDIIELTKALSGNPLANVWALQMVDALGKLPAGLMRGNLNFIGSYDECANIKAKINNSKTSGARYCKTRIGVPEGLMNMDTKGVDLKITLGMCVPDSCHKEDLIGLFQMPSIRNYTDILSHDVTCYEDESVRKDGSAIAAIVIFSVVLFLMILGTGNETIAAMSSKSSEPKSYDLNEKQTNGTAYTPKDKPVGVINHGYVSDEKESTSKTMDGLPRGYMPHKEDVSKNPVYIPPSRDGNDYSGSNGVSVEKVVVKVEEDKRVADSDQKQEPSYNRNNVVYISEVKDSLLTRIIKAFSVKTNAPKILAGSSGGGSINCIHGIRFLSISWIILGHTYNYGLASRINETWTIVNALDAFEILKRFTFQGVYGAGFSVDTFYMLSGLLLTYLQVKHLKKLMKKPKAANVSFYIIHYYFHRFWRLTPMYMAVLMFFACLYRYVGSGPLWVPEAGDLCKKTWWTNLLYVNNLVNVEDMCMGWSWFLANDMQFYAVSIVFLFFLTWSIPLGSVLIFLLMSAGIALAGWKEHIYNGSFLTFKSDGGAFWKNVYIAPWCRVAAFCIGLLTGIIMYKRQKKEFSRKLALLGWAIAVALGLGLVYCTYSENQEGGTPWSREWRSAYEALGRPLWAACVAWVIFACHNGRGGVVNSILSWEGIMPLSRLSYAAYLVHPIVMMICVYSKRSLVYLSDLDIIYLYLGHLTLTFMTAFVVSLAFEAPFMALEKIMFPPKKR